MGYRLRPGVTFCMIGDRLVLLDVTADRYLCLSGAAEGAFRLLIGAENPSAEAAAKLDRLLQAGILVGSEEDMPPQPCAAPAKPRHSLLDDPAAHASYFEIGTALVQLARAQLDLKYSSLGRALLRLERKKARALERPREQSEGLPSIAAAFDQAALFLTSLNRCLPRSVAVARRCLAAGIVPTVVLGVKLQPFAAHCWVQHADVLVNERIDGVRDFTPIRVI